MSGPRITGWTMLAAFATLAIVCLGMLNFGRATSEQASIFAMGFLSGMWAMQVWGSEDEVKS